MKISTPIEEFTLSRHYQQKLKRIGIKKVSDLIFHFPHRYEDFSKIIKIRDVKLNENCCLQGKILEIKSIRTWKKRMALTEAIIEDKTGAIKVVWFNQPYLAKNLKQGEKVCLAGKIMLGKGEIYLSNPAYEKIKLRASLTHTGRIIPVYPETRGVSSKWLRFVIKPLLMKFKDRMPETLPQEIITKEKLLPISKALWQIHFPDSMETAKKARYRFQFEGLFLIQLFVLREKIKLAQEKAVSLQIDKDLLKKFTQSLPFQLTDAQKKVSWRILKDLEKQRPTNRLLEGDVGSGKTVVAVLAALNTVKNGFQAVFMAPTEILAKQHFQEFANLLKNFNLNIGLLTGKEDKIISRKLKNQVIEISRAKLLEKAKGEINPFTKKINVDVDILIGTHALIQDKVKFGKLALVILDEQHRFGVKQRAKLIQEPKEKIDKKQSSIRNSKIPHLLSMTATPIPRTLALTIYGDLDLSLIDELPRGRKKIITKIVSPDKRQEAYNFIRREIKKQRQAFVICPRIESPKIELNNNLVTEDKKNSNNIQYSILFNKNFSSWSEVKAVEQEYEKLTKEIFPELKIEKLHGKMTLKEKERIMREFKNKKIDILVSTSVIEVGIDVPNATVMLIEGADRFGLAQLYQFRGRVGRSQHQSYCFLLTESPSLKTRKRLQALLTAKNSFQLAEKDLEIRGPGDFLGTKQWGIPDLAMSGLKNISLVKKTRKTAREILRQDPYLKNYSQLKERLKNFRNKVHLE